MMNFSFRSSSLLAISALFCLFVGLTLIYLADRDGRRNHALELVAADVELADKLSDHQDAVARFLALHSESPWLKIRIMRRRWFMAETVFDKLYKAEELNRDGAEEFLSERLDSLLLLIQQEGEHLLELELASPQALWRVHNLLGVSSLLQALQGLFQEREIEFVKAHLRMATTHLKKAIFWVDRVSEFEGLSNIPRWNLEFLSTNIKLSEIAKVIAGEPAGFNSRKNLATMLPESAGFMVGEPPDNRIRK